MTDVNGIPVNDATPTRRPRRRQKIALAVFLVVVVAFFGLVWLATRHDPRTANVGDCVRQTGADSVEVVGCDDRAATFKVVGRVENKTEVEAGLSACDPYVDQGAEQVFWSGKHGQTGLLLCLAKIR